jgi:hypothetical protein
MNTINNKLSKQETVSLSLDSITKDCDKQRRTTASPILNNNNNNNNDKNIKTNNTKKSTTRKKNSKQKYTEKSLYCLKSDDFPRNHCILLCESKWFERLSLFFIIINCFTLASFQPCDDIECVNARCVIAKYIDHVIFVFFIVEMLIKITALGFIGRKTYLGENWNILDFLIVCTGLAFFI